jgi:hypothetical protein
VDLEDERAGESLRDGDERDGDEIVGVEREEGLDEPE